jgi:hypothetical protein
MSRDRRDRGYEDESDLIDPHRPRVAGDGVAGGRSAERLPHGLLSKGG